MTAKNENGQNKLEHSLDTFLRPKNWEDYIGQETVKKNLETLILAAKERSQMPEHVLLHGSAGLGKTTLAYIISSQLDVPVQTTSGPIIERAGDVVSLISTLENGGVLFIDEIHRINKTAEEILYPIMESGKVSIMLGKGPTAQAVEINLPPITIIAATTQIGKLSAPLRSRFSGGILKLEAYKNEEVAKIIKQSAKLLNIKIDDEGADEIAKRSRCIPRTANYLLKRVRDYAQINKKDITKEISIKALSEREIDEYGLTTEDRNLLKIIHEIFNGGPVGIQALATTLSEDTQTIEEVYEPFLIQIGFLERGTNGRKITNKGKEYIMSCK